MPATLAKDASAVGQKTLMHHLESNWAQVKAAPWLPSSAPMFLELGQIQVEMQTYGHAHELLLALVHVSLNHDGQLCVCMCLKKGERLESRMRYGVEWL